jgi:putative FmdB family regulatory protein
MPTYEYKCLKCGKLFDALQKMSDKPLTQCIHCKGKVERQISAGSGLIFKGSGFYITDYKNKKSKSSDTSADKASPKKDSGGS